MTMKAFLFGSIVLALAARTSLVTGQAATCDGVLACHPGSTCVQGDADYSDQLKDVNGIAFEFHKALNKEGWHCDCDDEDFTGLRCNRPVEECGGDSDSDSNGTSTTSHVCYHGGKCIDGIDGVVAADQQYCDCADAEYNGKPYVGKYCEIEGAIQCGDSDIFCTNGGTCREDFQLRAHPCACPDGHRGPHCEFDTGFVPECDLDCENLGECTLGIKNYETAIYGEFWERHDGNFQYCSCTPDYFGFKCETQGQECGDNHCFHGASCLQTEHSDGDVENTCDCSAANSEKTSFAGEFCENVASSFCSKSEDQNGNLFCTNGGTCKEVGHDGCICPEGFHGPICEFRDWQQKEECNLKCQNGGRCRSGKKDNKLFQQFGDELKKFNETHRLWEHCVCPEGFFGIQCEHQLEICPGGEHVCLHGSKCVGENEVGGDDTHTCDCDHGFDAIEKYAGKFCQYTSTDICTKNGQPGVGKANFAFCVNNGICLKKVTDNEPHPGCNCEEGFRGDHCEFLETQLNSQSDPTSVPPDTSSGRNGLMVGLAISLLVLVALIGTALLRKFVAPRRASVKGPPLPKPEAIQTNLALDETVDMQSPEAPPVSSELQTVEII